MISAFTTDPVVKCFLSQEIFLTSEESIAVDPWWGNKLWFVFSVMAQTQVHQSGYPPCFWLQHNIILAKNQPVFHR